MQVELFIFRHGETDWNASERFQGHIDIPLNENGRTQARTLAHSLIHYSIDAILSSDLSRARETAEIVAQILNVPVFEDHRLRESHLGKAQGLTRHEIEQQFGRDLAVRWRSTHVTDADISYPGGETGNEIIHRVFESLEHFLSSHSFTRIGIATHGGVIRRVMQKLLPPHSPAIPIPNGVVYRLHYDPKAKQFSAASITSIQVEAQTAK